MEREYVVDQSGKGDFKTLGEAMKAAVANGVKLIRVRAGIYNETFETDEPYTGCIVGAE